MKGSLKDAIHEIVGAILLLTLQTEDDVPGKEHRSLLECKEDEHAYYYNNNT